MADPHRIFEDYDTINTIMETLWEVGFLQRYEDMKDDLSAERMQGMRETFCDLRLVYQAFGAAGRKFLFRKLCVDLTHRGPKHDMQPLSFRGLDDLTSGSNKAYAHYVKSLSIVLDDQDADRGRCIDEVLSPSDLPGPDGSITRKYDDEVFVSLWRAWFRRTLYSFSQLTDLCVSGSPLQLDGHLSMLANSPLRLTQLELRVQDHYDFPHQDPDTRVSHFGCRDASVVEMLKGLTVFRIGLPNSRFMWGFNATDEEFLESLQVDVQAMINHTRNVKLFAIGGWLLWPKRNHLNIPHNNLKGLTVSKSLFTSHALLDVLQRNKDTLKYIDMDHVELNEGHWDGILNTITIMLPQLSVIRLNGLMYSGEDRHGTPQQSWRLLLDKLPIESLRPKDLTAWFDLVDAVAQVRENGVLVKTCDFTKAGSVVNRTILHTKPHRWFSTESKIGTTRCCGTIPEGLFSLERCKRLKPCLPNRRGRARYWLCKNHVDQDVEDRENWPWVVQS